MVTPVKTSVNTGVLMSLRIFFIAASIILISTMSGAAEKLPEDIYIRNLEQGFSYENLYALRDGRIWTKPNAKNTGAAGEWKLFNKTGVPWGDYASSFKDTDRIVQFSTEGTMIVALSGSGRFYLWEPTLIEETVWHEKTGSPFEDALYIPENRTWCFSFSTMTAPWKRQTPMHEKNIVSYWEDIDGNRTEYGLTGTIYAVSADGQVIHYTDTGLPASWGRGFTSPERGRFIIENLSASASALFVINKTGKMYTRMTDFEMEGGCPALRYVYTRGKRTKGDEVAPLMTSIRTLPLPDWREQEPVEDLLASGGKGAGKSAITKNITILLTGKGNAARELRVQGRDRDGNYGYWKKMIYESRWDFVITGEPFDEKDVIKNYLGKSAEGKVLDKNYSGKVTKSGKDELPVELIGFYYYSTPARLRVHTNHKYFDIEFHTVDLWSPTVQKKYYPALVGSPDGEPKLLQGAIVIPDDLLKSEDPDIREAVDKYFIKFNRQPIAFTVSADDRRVSIRSKTLQRSLDKSLDYEFRDSIEIDAVNPDYDREPHPSGFFTSMAARRELELQTDIPSMTKRDIPEVIRLIEVNNKALDDINSVNKSLQRENLRSGCTTSCILAVYCVFNSIVTIIGLPHWDLSGSSPGVRENITQLGGVSYTGGTPLKEFSALNLKEAFAEHEDYKSAVRIVSSRIALLEKLREELALKPD